MTMPPITSAPAPDEPAGRLALERMVLFTDAVFAIVMTLMAIEIRLPSHPADGWTQDTLSHALAELGPRFLAYAVSFLAPCCCGPATCASTATYVRSTPGSSG
jgi:hypothetical protein